ncbi:hypothetical protein D478_10895 [Brevibacillus agri BAB-2500]|nr:hypothetical protein D478_10895 [Brevibacillus agri BAB-2500]
MPPEAKPTDGQQPKPESPVQNENNGAGQNEANNEKPLPAEQPGLTAQLILDDNFLKLLANNEINGFDIAIGMKKEEVVKRYGAVVKKDFLDGGQYAVLEKLDDGIVFLTGRIAYMRLTWKAVAWGRPHWKRFSRDGVRL